MYRFVRNLTLLSSQKVYQFSTNNVFDTIYALSSGINTAISIIRISGPQSYKCLKLLQKDQHKINQKINHQQILNKLRIRARYAHFRKFYKPNSNMMIDQGIILYFPHFCSYNRQQMFQFHLHGSKAVVSLIFQQLQKLGMRMATKGQFTKRALINGRLSIFQAQAINDLIRSQSQFSRQVAVNQLLGKNNNFLFNLRKQLIGNLAKTQAYIDFSETQTDVKETLFQQTKKQTLKTIQKVQSILKNYKNLQIIKDGVKICIFGRPNVGKSSLMNFLSQRQVSIVNEQAGTTRDIVQANIQVSGVKVILYDTAGLRQQVNSKIQQQGIKRAKNIIENSHFQILMIDWQQQLSVIKNQRLIIKDPFKNITLDSNFNRNNSIIIVNKADLLPQHVKFVQIQGQLQIFKQPIIISVQNKKGIQQFNQILQQKIKNDYKIYQNSQQIYFTRQRYFDHLKICKQQLQKYVQIEQADISCQHLRQAIKSIEQIFGRVDCQDVLDAIFRDFCIGK